MCHPLLIVCCNKDWEILLKIPIQCLIRNSPSTLTLQRPSDEFLSLRLGGGGGLATFGIY